MQSTLPQECMHHAIDISENNQLLCDFTLIHIKVYPVVLDMALFTSINKDLTQRYCVSNEREKRGA